MDHPAADAFPNFDRRLADALVGQDGGPGEGLAEGLSGFLGMRIVRIDPGVVVIEVAARDELVHRFGAVHGGVVATLVDQALGSVVFPLVPLGTWPATLEFKVNYLAAARSGTLRATGRVVSLRRRTAVVQVDVENEVGGACRPVAVALGTLSLNAPRQPDPPPTP
jgi:1,4-dihydroxy-2-naphthoyl-CoA hydrolase